MECVDFATLEALVEFYLGDWVSLLVGKVVEFGFELVGVDSCHLGESCNGGWEEDEQACADQGEIYGAGEGSRSGDDFGALEEFECQWRQDEGWNCHDEQTLKSKRS